MAEKVIDLSGLTQPEIAAALVGKRIRVEDTLVHESRELNVRGIRFPENPLATSAICYLQYEGGSEEKTIWDGVTVILLE